MSKEEQIIEFLVNKFGKEALDHFYNLYKDDGHELYYEDDQGQCVAIYKRDDDK